MRAAHGRNVVGGGGTLIPNRGARSRFLCSHRKREDASLLVKLASDPSRGASYPLDASRANHIIVLSRASLPSTEVQIRPSTTRC